jgi:hypothetical protein
LRQSEAISIWCLARMPVKSVGCNPPPGKRSIAVTEMFRSHPNTGPGFQAEERLILLDLSGHPGVGSDSSPPRA